MVFETGYREFVIQHPYMITVDGDAKYHISYFFVRPWWGNLDWGCTNKFVEEPNRFGRRCKRFGNRTDWVCGQNEICNQCGVLPFASMRTVNMICMGHYTELEISRGKALEPATTESTT